MSSEIFASSTCWDLIDIRAEIGKTLTECGFGVRSSDDYESLFEVNPNLDSVDSCLENVENSDVILCVIDRRYGPLLPASHGSFSKIDLPANYGSISATECEIRRATKLGKPVFTFIRKNMERDYEAHRSGSKLLWTMETDDPSDPNHPDRLTKFMKFIGERRRLPKTNPQSNWIDSFETIVDLKPRILSRVG